MNTRCRSRVSDAPLGEREISFRVQRVPQRYMLGGAVRPRYVADYRTLCWALVFAPSAVALQFAKPSLSPYLLGMSCYLAIACGVVAHNHNHCPTFANKRLNDCFAA